MQKQSIKSRLIEALLELLIVGVALVIGWLILSIFGVNVIAEGIDFEWLVLIGIAIFLVIFIIVHTLISCYERKQDKQ